jgi:hypothetical protein
VAGIRGRPGVRKHLHEEILHIGTGAINRPTLPSYMTPDEVRVLTGIVPIAVGASLPAVVGFVAAYARPSFRKNMIRGSGKIALSFVNLCLLISLYYLLQHVLGGDVYWPDTITTVVVGGVLLVVVVSTYTLALSAVGLWLGASVRAWCKMS